MGSLRTPVKRYGFERFKYGDDIVLPVPTPRSPSPGLPPRDRGATYAHDTPVFRMGKSRCLTKGASQRRKRQDSMDVQLVLHIWETMSRNPYYREVPRKAGIKKVGVSK